MKKFLQLQFVIILILSVVACSGEEEYLVHTEDKFKLLDCNAEADLKKLFDANGGDNLYQSASDTYTTDETTTYAKAICLEVNERIRSNKGGGYDISSTQSYKDLKNYPS